MEPNLYTVVLYQSLYTAVFITCHVTRASSKPDVFPLLPCALVMSSTLPWRTSHKNRAPPTSLSLIIATPQVAPPTTSALAHLPAIKMTHDVKSRSTAVEGVMYPVYMMFSKQNTLLDLKSQANAETQSPLDHSGRQCFRYLFYFRLFFPDFPMRILAGFAATCS